MEEDDNNHPASDIDIGMGESTTIIVHGTRIRRNHTKMIIADDHFIYPINNNPNLPNRLEKLAINIYIALKGLKARSIRSKTRVVKEISATHAAIITQMVMRDMLGGIFSRTQNIVTTYNASLAARRIQLDDEVPPIVRRFYASYNTLLRIDTRNG